MKTKSTQTLDNLNIEKINLKNPKQIIFIGL